MNLINNLIDDFNKIYDSDYFTNFKSDFFNIIENAFLINNF